VTPENREALKNDLLKLLIVYSAGPRPILIQICVSIAALGMQLKTWIMVVSDVVGVCKTSGKSEDALLQFLAVLPEEVYDNRRMILTV
jgi:transportin-3